MKKESQRWYIEVEQYGNLPKDGFFSLVEIAEEEPGGEKVPERMWGACRIPDGFVFFSFEPQGETEWKWKREPEKIIDSWEKAWLHLFSKVTYTNSVFSSFEEVLTRLKGQARVWSGVFVFP